jgi:hypothetical protein
MAKVFLDNHGEFYHTFITYSLVLRRIISGSFLVWHFGGCTYGIVE